MKISAHRRGGPLIGDPPVGYRGPEVGLVRPRLRRESGDRTSERPAAIAELRARQRKRVAAIRKLNARYAGRPFPKRAAETWNRLSRELEETEELITGLRAPCETHGGRERVLGVRADGRDSGGGQEPQERGIYRLDS
jgi:hypothetical protein